MFCLSRRRGTYTKAEYPKPPKILGLVPKTVNHTNSWKNTLYAITYICHLMSLEIWLWQNRLFTSLCVSARGQNTHWKVENDVISTETDKTTSQFTHLIGKKNATKANYYYICSKISKCLYFNYKNVITTPNSQSGHAPWTGEGKSFIV